MTISLRIARRIKKETEALKKRYEFVFTGGTTKIEGTLGTVDTIIIITFPSVARPGKAIQIRFDLSKNYPFSAPKIEMSNYEVKFIKDWNAQTLLVDLVKNLKEEIIQAELDGKVLKKDGVFDEGANFVFRNKLTTEFGILECSICKELTFLQCMCCSKPFCSTECQNHNH